MIKQKIKLKKRNIMKQNKLIAALALSLSLSLTSCSDDKATDSQQAVATKIEEVKAHSKSEIMNYIPAETPVLMLFAKDPNNPLPENLKNKMEKVYGSLGDIMKMAMEENFKKYAKDDAKSIEMKSKMDKWLSEEGIEKLGFSLEENEFAFYAVDLFPVLRMTLAKSHSMGEVLDEIMSEAQPDSASKKEVDGHSVYQFGDKELQVIISLAGNTVVASLSPTRDVDKLMPKLLGFEKPSKSLVQSNQYQDTLSKYNYLSNSLYWINIRQLADYFVNPDKHDSAMLDVLKIEDKMLSADCKTEILAMIDKFPRLVGGSTLIENHKLDSHMIIEMEEGLGTKFSTLSGRIPATKTKAALSYGFSFDIAAAKSLAQEFVTNIQTTPYKCELLEGMNSQAATIAEQLAQPLPPFVSNFKGVNVVIDELDLDMSKTDPSEMVKNLKAKFLLAVDNPEALKGMAEMMMPDLQKLGIKTGADAVNVSSLIPISGSQMPINLDHVFMAMGVDTIGLSLGEGTDTELTSTVSGESTSDLLTFSIDADLYKDIFAGIEGISANLPAEVKTQLSMQKAMMTDMLWWQNESGSLDFTDRGFEVKVDIIY